MFQACANGHQLRGPSDVLPDGKCRHCNLEAARKYRARNQKARKMIEDLQEAGIDLADLDKARTILVAAKLLSDLTGTNSALAELSLQKNPELCRRAVALVQRLAETVPAVS
jgi:hypothetical protein